MVFRSSSGVVIGLIAKFCTSTFNTLGVMNAGRDGPRRLLNKSINIIVFLSQNLRVIRIGGHTLDAEK